MKRFLAILTGICLAAGCAGAEAAGTEEKALELAGSSLRFPAVSGMEDEALQEEVNRRIREDLRIEEYVQRMNALISDGERHMTVSWTGGVLGDVFSAALEAEGAVRGGRDTHERQGSCVDLRDGREIALGELFADEAAGREALEAYLEEKAAPELSPHLSNASLTPLPERFLLERTGLTLLYGAEQLSTLSDRAGAVKIGWNEIREVLDRSPEGIPERIGAGKMMNLTEESPARIREMTEAGQFPDLPVRLGDSVKEWTDRLRLLTDPDEYAGGRMFAPEDPGFRNVYLLSDAVDSGWEQSRVQGIRMDRGCVWGLCIGETRAEEWRRILGEPDTTVHLDPEEAELRRTVPGDCDYYQFGEHRLQLQADEEGLLAGITLAE